MKEAKCVLEIDLAKIRFNYSFLSNICKKSEVAAVVKANSYGLGANVIAPTLQDVGCKIFFVASIEEGIGLREVLGKSASIFVFNGVFYNDTEALQHYGLIPVLNNLKQVEIWQECALSSGNKLECLIHIDTGMNRLGMSAKEIQTILTNPGLLSGLEIKYIVSHLSASEIADNPHNDKQLRLFKHYLNAFPKGKASLANSSSIFLGPQYHFDLTRPGAALYGISPLAYGKENPMQNPVRLVAPIIQLQELSPENYIGYNMTFETKRTSMIATLPLGYADGYPRSLSNKGEVYIGKYRAPIVGRISMDLITIDVTDLPPEEIFLGQEVEIIGNNCTPDKIANIIGTIGYEILTMLGNRYKKVYKNDLEFN
jgi:alanine racemase